MADAIRDFTETHIRRPFAMLCHPSRVSVYALNDTGWLFSFNGVQVYLDDKIPLTDEHGEILFLLGDCVEPAMRIYRVEVR